MLRGICAGVATPCCATTTWIFGSAFSLICGLLSRWRRLLIPASLVRFTPGEWIHEQAAFLVEFLLSHLGLFLCRLPLLFGHRFGLLQLLDTQGGIKFFCIILQVKQARSAIGCNHEGQQRMAIGVFSVRCFGEAEQLFLRLFDAFHVLVMIRLAVAVEDRASSGARDLICLRCEWLDRQSKRDEILYHCELVADFLHRYDRVVKALKEKRYLLLLL